jgi:CDP-L-myo-inositol myo-inositolphosphotransferase
VNGEKIPAVILAAGKGERLTADGGRPKPLIPLLGLSLLERTILSCREAGIDEFFVVLGHRGEEIEPYLARWERHYHLSITQVTNPNWEGGNGASALSCAPYLKTSLLLLMCDHLFDPGAIPHLIAEEKEEGACSLLVDRRLDRVFDREDATCVRVTEGRITAIGKGLSEADGIDTGIFLCAVGIEERSWLDIDTPQALREGRQLLMRSLGKPDEDGVVSHLFNRPISIRISVFLVTHPLFSRFTPNAISLASFLLVLSSAFLFTLKGYWAIVAAGVLLELGSIVDGCDGEVARLTFRTSRFGAWFDTLLDRYGDAAVVIGITCGFSRFHTGPLVWVGGSLALSGFLLASYTKKEHVLRYGEPLSRGLWTLLSKRDLRLFALFLGALFGRPYLALIVMGFISHFGIGLLFWQGREIVE